MKPLGDEIQHYWLVTGMAQLNETGIARAYAEGRMSQEDWADMVQRCRKCDWSDACESWQNEQADSVAAPPQPCRNRQTLMRLKAGGRAVSA